MNKTGSFGLPGLVNVHHHRVGIAQGICVDLRQSSGNKERLNEAVDPLLSYY